MGDVPGPGGIEEQLRQEVRELTDLLRDDPAFADIRDVLTARGLHASEVLLAGLIGGEDNSQYGVFVTADAQCVRFETGPDSRLIRWEPTNDVDVLAQDFAAAAIGIAMRRAGDVA